MPYLITALQDGLWAIQDGNVRMFLLDGDTDALLIDTGYGSGDLRALVSSLVSCPVTVIHTHTHADHIGGDGQFDRFLLCEAYAPDVLPLISPAARVRYVQENGLIRLGTLELDVIQIPGHAPGAIALLDRKRRTLFSGDTFAKGYPIYMQYPGQDMARYLDSMRQLLLLSELYDRVLPCHGELELDQTHIQKHIACCRSILDGSAAPGVAQLYDGTDSRAAWYEDVAIFY